LTDRQAIIFLIHWQQQITLLNNGTGTLSSVNITSPSSSNYDQYQVAYTAGSPEASTDYVVTDLTTGATVPNTLTIAAGGQSRTIEFKRNGDDYRRPDDLQ